MCCALLAACGASLNLGSGSGSNNQIVLNVFAGSSLTESFNEIAANYHKLHPNVTVRFNYGGSQNLVQQIKNGANCDIFASADFTNMKKASDANLVNASQVFVKNKQVVIVPIANAAGISSLHDLAKKGVKLDLAAEVVPAGTYTRKILANMSKSPEYGASFKNEVLANVVSEEDEVKAVVQKIQLNEADAGFVYQSDVTPAVAPKVKVFTIPDNFNIIAQYPIATIKSSAHPKEAQDFMNYILSSAGQTVLTQHNFISVNQ
jgi:molybdate transport system substrate-binding protein